MAPLSDSDNALSSSTEEPSDTTKPPPGPQGPLLAWPWVAADPGLLPWLPVIAEREAQYQQVLSNICTLEGSLHAFCFAGGLQRFGLQRGTGGVWYREWAPAALAASLVGDFNGWDPSAHRCRRADDGVFEVFVPDRPDGRPALPPGGRYKVALRLGGSEEGAWEHRVPAWAKQTTQEPASGDFAAVAPSAELLGRRWRHARPPPPASLHIYEAHVGIASVEPVVARPARAKTGRGLSAARLRPPPPRKTRIFDFARAGGVDALPHARAAAGRGAGLHGTAAARRA